MSTLAVIGTFYRRPWALPHIAYTLRAQSRKPDELWMMWQDEEDVDAICDYLADEAFGFGPPHRVWDTPAMTFVEQVRPEGQNPLGVAINQALDATEADYITYLTDDSLPHPDKYRLMAQALDENPDWGAVYCGQDYGTVESPEAWLAAAGRYDGHVRHADTPEPDPFCRVDHTQVMHRRTAARWPLSYDDRKLSDAHFFRALVEEKGPLMPVPQVLDWTRQLPDGLSRR